MINFEITASPSIGKKTELLQSVDSIRNKIGKICDHFKVTALDNGGYTFTFHFDSEEQAEKLFDSESFLLLTGAIKTLCDKTSYSINGKKINFTKISSNHISKTLINN
ncbi:hypothetical protein MNBD_IGNAVI01-3133 [hydrothermal vent metagenome]|uniref:ABM domain-containing protein n=1 Tax=hydrothermal vent metagenome TaxID=652676 RepID=A0A3B1CBK9_9ZZZZ